MSIDHEELSRMGFLRAQPEEAHPEPFDRISHAARGLPRLVAEGSDVLRRELNALPLLDIGDVDHEHRRGLLRDYLYLQSAYVLAPPKRGVVPANLAVPAYRLSAALKMKPVLSYTSIVLDNWTGTLFVNNTSPLVTFTHTKDETVFLKAHIFIERSAGLALSRLEEVQRVASEAGQRHSMIAKLGGITAALRDMRSHFPYLKKGCDPAVYFEKIRPWFAGLEDVVFQGVGEYGDRAQSFVGASGAQSSILPAIDAALGVRHKRTYGSAYLEKMREYMPQEHAAFIRDLESRPSVRTFVAAEGSDRDLLAAYNECIEALRLFRQAHVHFVGPYIKAHDGQALGTGGSHFEVLLNQYIADTEDAKL